MTRRFRRGFGFTVVATLSGCHPTGPIGGDEELRCPEPSGEFPSTDCAIVAGTARDSAGNPLALPAIRVDSAIPSVAYLYASGTVHPNADGSYEIIVFRVNRLRPPLAPDTATVELKAYGQLNPNAGDRPAAAASVVMQFAQLGGLVPRTAANARFSPR